MRGPFAVLGLTHDATLPEVKKAYAKLLKQTRPEEDAAAFQLLQQAYEACLALVKSRQAAPRSLVVAGDDGEPVEPVEVPAGDQSQLRDPPSRSRIEPMAPPPPLRSEPGVPGTPPARRAAPAVSPEQVRALLAEIVAAGEGQSAFRLRQWLHDHDQLVSLDVQHAVARELPAFIVQTRPRLDTERLGVLYDYFIGGGLLQSGGDPHVRRAWEQVQAQEMATRELSALRRRQHSRIERLMLDELLEPPSTWRRRLLLAIPLMADRMAKLLAAVQAISQPPAAPILQGEAAAFWSGLGLPGRLNWRIAGLAHAQMLVCLLLVIGPLGAIAGLDPVGMASLALAGLMYFSIVWFTLKGLAILRHRISTWRERQRAQGRQPPDLHVTIGYSLGGLAAIAAVLQYLQPDNPLPMAVALTTEILVVLYLVCQGRGHRWEMAVLAALSTAATWRTLAVLVGSWVPELTIMSASFAVGAVLGVACDQLHAAHERIRPEQSRKEVNFIALVLGGMCLLVLFMGLDSEPKTDVASPSAVAARQEREARDAAATEMQQRMLERIARAEEAALPWNKWARENGITSRPRFESVDEAFATIRAAVTPQDPASKAYREFYVPDGPLAGHWIFSGGGRSGPARMVHYSPPDAHGDRAPGQMLCRPADAGCKAFEREAETAPVELSQQSRQLPGGRFTWDSPVRPALSYRCPPAQLGAYDVTTQQSVRVKILFDPRGELVDFMLVPTGVPSIDRAVFGAASSCTIVPTEGQPGILEDWIRLSPP